MTKAKPVYDKQECGCIRCGCCYKVKCSLVKCKCCSGECTRTLKILQKCEGYEEGKPKDAGFVPVSSSSLAIKRRQKSSKRVNKQQKKK